MTNKQRYFLLTALVFFSFIFFAMGDAPPDPGGGPGGGNGPVGGGSPLNGGLIFLLTLGLGSGIRKFWKSFKHQIHKSS